MHTGSSFLSSVSIRASQKEPAMSEFKTNDYVVYKDVAHEFGIYPTSLFKVTRTVNKWKYLEITETKCWHHNRKRWGSYGGDIRHATLEEIAAGHRIDTKQIEEVGDDRDMSQHISPNCKAKDV
jgi:hypothetical protein